MNDSPSPSGPGGPLPSEEHKFQRLVEAATDYAIYMLDPEGRVTSWNTGAQRIKGYTTEEVLGQDFALFFTAEDRASGLPRRALRTAAEAGRFEHEGWRVRKDGSRFWVLAALDAIRDDDGTLVGYVKISRDMTERKKAEEALRASERHFRLLVEGVTDYAIFMLDPAGRIANWNPGAERIKGYRSEEIVGRHFSCFYTAEDRERQVPEQALETAAREGIYEQEGWRLRKDGSRFWAHSVLNAVREDGELVGFAKITRDVTERREAQEALEAAREQLLQAQKMEAIGQLTGGISHDFNNLLQALSSCLQLVERRSDDPRILELLVTGRQAIERGAKLTGQLLAFARREALRSEPVDIAGRLLGTAELLTRALRADIELDIDLEPGLWPIEGDPTQFELAMLNLVINARDAMPDGGQLRVEARNRTLEPARHRDGLTGDFVMLTVSDSGYGMAPEVLARAMDPFFTTKAVGAGTGLGLSQVYGFARQSGGSVRLESEPGQGTTVTLLLPRSTGAVAAETGAAPAASEGYGRILMVEDDAVVGPLVASTLEDLGYSVTRAANADEALEALQAGAIDLLFTDIVMPGTMSGIDLAQEARRLHPDLPILLTTGYSEQIARDEDLKVLSKPYEISELASALNAELTRRRR